MSAQLSSQSSEDLPLFDHKIDSFFSDLTGHWETDTVALDYPKFHLPLRGDLGRLGLGETKVVRVKYARDDLPIFLGLGLQCCRNADRDDASNCDFVGF